MESAIYPLVECRSLIVYPLSMAAIDRQSPITLRGAIGGGHLAI
ncbi:hypothetical protein [Lysobacter sp. CA196]